MELTSKQLRLLEFVKSQHGDQVRKYTNEPYWEHPLSVAKRLDNLFPLSTEVALCHDLIEDTECSSLRLNYHLLNMGYNAEDSSDICNMVIDLTDVYVKEDYPELNRATRKALECERLSTIDERSMSVKMADLIDNSISILEHDKNFAKVYIKEKKNLLSSMKGGDSKLREECYKVIDRL